jgi:MFS family permease
VKYVARFVVHRKGALDAQLLQRDVLGRMDPHTSGFAVCYAALIALEHAPSFALLYLTVVSQGFLGYAVTSVMRPIVAEIFEGPHYGSIFGTVTVALIGGGAAGPWLAGIIHDATGSNRLAFLLAIACCVISAAAIWIAAPRKVRLVPGRI